MDEVRQWAIRAAQAAADKKANDVVIIDVADLLVVTDYFVICHGRSQTHVDAIAESLEEWAEQHGLRHSHREGGRGSTWVILDYGSVVAHIFTEEAREFYDLERLWGDAPVVEHVAEA